MPAPKPILVKELSTGITRKFKSQFAADEFYGHPKGYFKDVRTKLGGRNRKYEIIEIKEAPKEV